MINKITSEEKQTDEDSDIGEIPNRETKELMIDYDLDLETAERVLEIMEEYGVDEEEAIELEENL